MACEAKEKEFKFWMPLDVVKGKEGELRVGGVATDETSQDIQGETVFVDGLDVTYLTQRGAFNWDHGKDPGDILGEIDTAQKQGKKLYVEGLLYPHVKKAAEVYNLMRSLKDSESKRKLGLSLEGKVKERDLETGKCIRKAWIKNVAVTYNPINQGTWVDLIKSLGSFTFNKCEGDCSKCSYCEEDLVDKAVSTEGEAKESTDQPTTKETECKVVEKSETIEGAPKEVAVQESASVPALDRMEEAPPSETVEKADGNSSGAGGDEAGLKAGHDIPATSGGISGSALRKEDLERKAKVTTYGKKKKRKKEGEFTKSELIEWFEEERGYPPRMAELITDLIFKAVQIKGYIRARRGRLERVKPFTRELTHELYRLRTMSDEALATRARKITHPEKLLHFYHAAKSLGKGELAGYIKSQGHKLGLTSKDFEAATDPVRGGLREARRAFRAA